MRESAGILRKHPPPEAVPPPVNVFNHVPGVEGGPGAYGSLATVRAAEPAQEALVDPFVDLIALRARVSFL